MKGHRMIFSAGPNKESALWIAPARQWRLLLMPGYVYIALGRLRLRVERNAGAV